MQPILLASSSPYRRQLLEKLGISFKTDSPDIDESLRAGESASDLVLRLSNSKAEALSPHYPNHIIIASDQVASLNSKILTKPLNRANAISQLTLCRGHTVTFHTGLTVLNTKNNSNHTLEDIFEVRFRELEDETIARYVDAEQPFDCAGSFKAEGLGISLFASMHGKDPNTLIGLPLIELVTLLNNEGIQIP